MTFKLQLALLFTSIFTGNGFAQEFEFIVSPENCGKMTIVECEEFMVWAKKDSEDTQKRIDEDRANIRRMHEEVLGMLKDNTEED